MRLKIPNVGGAVGGAIAAIVVLFIVVGILSQYCGPYQP